MDSEQLLSSSIKSMSYPMHLHGHAFEVMATMINALPVRCGIPYWFRERRV